MADWLKIKAEYISGCGSLRELAEKHGVSHNTLRKKAADGKWKDERTSTKQKVHKKIVQRIVQKNAEREADRIVRLLQISDHLADKLERAAEELGEQYTKKRKTSGTEVTADGRLLDVEETVEVAEYGPAAISSTSLRQLAATLRDLCEVQRAGAPDTDSLARLDKLIEGITDAAKQ